MTFEIALAAGTVCLLILISAFFSGSETALTAASRARLHGLELDGLGRAKTASQLLENPERLIGGILLGNNLVNILASALATSVFLSVFGEAGVVYATLTMTALVLIFGEVMPKTYAITNPVKAALAVAPFIRVVVAIFGPITNTVQKIVRFFLRLLGANIDETIAVLSAHEELRGAIELHHKEGAVIKRDRDMLGGVLDLMDLEVEDVMIHRTQMHTINAGDGPEEIVNQVLASPYTRLPIWQGEPDNFVGIIHAKTLLQAVHDVGDFAKLDPVSLATPPWFVPDTTPLREQLNAFLKRKGHFALVVDEYGEVQGLVTLEDILEEIVGEIIDEHDEMESGIRPLGDGSVIVDGSLPARDLNRALDWELPEDEATTVAGLVINKSQSIPQPGQAFTFDGFRFEVLRRHRNRLTSLKITRLPRA